MLVQPGCRYSIYIGSNLFLTGEISPKHEKKIWNFENELTLEHFDSQKQENKNKNHQISIFGSMCSVMNIDSWLKIFTSHLVYRHIFGYIFLGMIAIFASFSYG
jgi:hypothetical protein